MAESRHTVLAPYLKPGHCGIGSINSPMQCMMKEICAQCLQPHVDPKTGKKSYVFSCFNQDQELDHVDWPALDQRLKQNSTQEKLTATAGDLQREAVIREREQKLLELISFFQLVAPPAAQAPRPARPRHRPP